MRTTASQNKKATRRAKNPRAELARNLRTEGFIDGFLEKLDKR
jgi:hypothetical protein